MEGVGETALCFFLAAFTLTCPAQVSQYTEALKLAPSSTDAAIASLEQLTAEQPDFIEAYGALISIARRSGIPQRAAEHFESLRRLPRAEPYALYGLAAYYNSQQEFARAEQRALDCLRLMPNFIPAYGELARSASDKSRQIRITKRVEHDRQSSPDAAGPMYARAMLHLNRAEWKEAIPLLTNAARAAPDSWGILDALFHAYYQTDQSANTLDVLNRALATSLQQNHLERVGIVLGRLGIVQSDLGDYNKAVDNLSRAVGIAQELGLMRLEQAYRGNLGNTLLLTGRHDDALIHLEKALALARQTGDRPNEGRDLGLIAAVLLDRADYPGAIRAFTQAADIARQTGDRASEADQTASLALIHSQLGDSDRALHYVRKALAIARALGNPWLEGRFLEIRGSMLAAAGNRQEALASLQQGIRIARNVGDRMGEASRTAYAAETQARLGQRSAALGGLESALRLARRIGARGIEARILNDLGTIRAGLSQPELALDSFDAARRIGEEIGMPEVIWRAHRGMARGLERLNRQADAVPHYQAAIDAIERVRSVLPLPEEQIGFFESKASVYSDYARLLAAAHKKEPHKHFDSEAFYVVERSRARSLLALTAEARGAASNADGDKLLELEIQAARLERELSREYSRADVSAAKVANLRGSLIEIEDRHQALRRAAQPSPAASVRSPSPVRLEEARLLLNPQTALLVYSVGVEASQLLVVTTSGFTTARLPRLADLSPRVFALREAVSKRPAFASAQSFLREARGLYRLVLEPVRHALEGKTELIIASDGPLQQLPFALLLTNEVPDQARDDYQNLPYLVRKYDIGYVPSVSVLAAIRARSKTESKRPDRIMVVGDAHYSDQSVLVKDLSGFPLSANAPLPRLVHSRSEAESIANLYRPDRRTLLIGQDAIEENVKRDPLLANYDVIHFAVHGVVNETRPQYSALILSTPAAGAAEDGVLHASEIARMDIRARLVGLSACSTALGRSAEGEGLLGLTHACLGAGANSVLATFWRVDDRSTAVLMTDFYRTYRESGRAAEALRKAQLRLIDSFRFAHPYYWAAAAVFGDGG